MKEPQYKLCLLLSKKNLPLELLLLADETKEVIEKYIYDSDVYVLTKDLSVSPIAVFALYKNNDVEIEIKNIAVLESLQVKELALI